MDTTAFMNFSLEEGQIQEKEFSLEMDATKYRTQGAV
jgi:hypothetical protein